MKYLKMKGKDEMSDNEITVCEEEGRIKDKRDRWNARDTKTGGVGMNAVPLAIHLQMPESNSLICKHTFVYLKLPQTH